jgi:mRNA interferase MazF
MEVESLDIVLCEFYFSDLNSSKKRPVLVFKDNLPYNDFIAIPISSNIEKLHKDEYIINNQDLENGSLPKESKVMLRKTFVVSKDVIIKKYGTLNKNSFAKYHHVFCNYFGCNNKK